MMTRHQRHWPRSLPDAAIASVKLVKPACGTAQFAQPIAGASEPPRTSPCSVARGRRSNLEFVPESTMRNQGTKGKGGETDLQIQCHFSPLFETLRLRASFATNVTNSPCLTVLESPLVHFFGTLGLRSFGLCRETSTMEYECVKTKSTKTNAIGSGIGHAAQAWHDIAWSRLQERRSFDGAIQLERREMRNRSVEKLDTQTLHRIHRGFHVILLLGKKVSDTL